MTDPNVVPRDDASVAINVEDGAEESNPPPEDDSLKITPEGAIRIPLMMGTALDAPRPLTLPVPCNPAELK
jgi:hypothetical protein